MKMPRGILLYGPSGCGKTILAQATLNSLNYNSLQVKGPELLNKYIGQSEQAVRDIFEKAYQMRPTIIFFDEFDAIVPKRNSGSSGVTDRVVNQFLCYLDGVQDFENVYIIAASSRPDVIDPALLRPGRIDKHIYLPFPSEEERKQIINMYIQNIKLSEEIDIQYLSDYMVSYTSADIVAFFKEIRIQMAYAKLNKYKKEKGLFIDEGQVSESDVITKETIEKSRFRSSMTQYQINKLNQQYENFKNKGVIKINEQKQMLQ